MSSSVEDNLRTTAGPAARAGAAVARAPATGYTAPVALLDALRAITRFDPPAALPDCDLALLADVLEAHGLAPLASWQVEHTRLGAGLPDAFRERLLTSFQGVVNDNLTKLVTLRGLLRGIEDVPVVVLEAAAYVDWLYPHLAFRPLGELRLAVRGADGRRFAEAVKGTMSLARAGEGGRTAVFTDGTTDVALQEGLWPGAPEDAALFERSRPYRVFGPGVARPAPEEALLATVADLALQGLFAPAIAQVDLRELLRGGVDAPYVLERARALGLSRALHGATLVVAHLFPDVAEAAAAVRPPLGAAERLAVEQVAEAARDPARLRHLRGADAAARLVVAPRGRG
ncbi:MAG TPA: nucleotidyltransferase family protein [Anaeromyxobacter sp.]|nr:nucleotidyltransferase family protein [Anaeromyxobacter sp.]